jgi:ABC-type amino acid transport substrate-binding protein
MLSRLMALMAMVVISLILICQPLDAQSEPPIKVGISPFKPFVILDGEKPTGISIDAWRILAREMDIKYDFIKCKGVADKLQRLEDGSIDIAIGGITITEARENLFDFTHPVYHTGLDILVPKSGRPTLLSLLSSLFKGPKIIFFLGLLILIFSAGHVIWLVERSSRKKATSFHRNYFPGVFEGMYWALITASTIGYGDKVPKRWIGRIITGILIIIFLPLFGYFIAELSSDLTIQNLKININGPQDLRGRTVGVVKGTTGQEYMEKEPAYINAFENVEDAIEALLEGTVDAVVYDAPNLLNYANGHGKGKVAVIGKLFEPQDYGLALPAGSPLRETINRALLGLMESDELENINKKWLGHKSSN